MKISRTLTGLVVVVAGIVFCGAAIAAHGGHGGGGHSGGGHGGNGSGHGGPHGLPHGGYGYALGGAFVGGPWFWGLYDTWPFYDDYYFAPDAMVPNITPAYIEQRAPGASPQPADAFWYYCDNPAGYYPYVQNCPAGWQRVRPQAPPGGY